MRRGKMKKNNRMKIESIEEKVLNEIDKALDDYTAYLLTEIEELLETLREEIEANIHYYLGEELPANIPTAIKSVLREYLTNENGKKTVYNKGQSKKREEPDWEKIKDMNWDDISREALGLPPVKKRREREAKRQPAKK